MYKLVDYIISLTNLNGLVHKDKVLDIFNLQNEEKIDIEALNSIMRNSPADLA